MKSLTKKSHETINLMSCLLLLAIAFFASIKSYSQNPNWIYGNQLIHFSNSGITTSPLPQPGSNPALHYTGQIPTHGQNCQFDNQGNLLFFIIDGNIYDRDGFIMARYSQFISDSLVPYMNCYFDDIAITTVPGYCNKFYIFYTVQYVSGSTRTLGLCSILDLAMPNPFFPNDPNRVGSLVESEANSNNTDPFFYFFNSANPALQMAQHYSMIITGNNGVKKSLNSFEIIEITENHKILAISSLDDGIKVLDLTPGNITVLFDNMTNGSGAYGSAHSCIQSRPNQGGGYLLAATSTGVSGQTSPGDCLIVLYNINQLNVVSLTQEIAISSTPYEKIVSFEFSPDGSKLWFVKTFEPKIGVIDLNNNSISYPLTSSLASFGLSEMESQIDITGNQVLYLSSASGLYQLNNPNNPTSASIANVPWASGINPCTADAWNLNNQDLVYTLQVQNTGSNIIQNYLSSATCCHDFVVIHDEAPTQITPDLDGNWYYGQNPFSNQSSL